MQQANRTILRGTATRWVTGICDKGGPDATIAKFSQAMSVAYNPALEHLVNYKTSQSVWDFVGAASRVLSHGDVRRVTTECVCALLGVWTGKYSRGSWPRNNFARQPCAQGVTHVKQLGARCRLGEGVLEGLFGSLATDLTQFGTSSQQHAQKSPHG